MPPIYRLLFLHLLPGRLLPFYLPRINDSIYNIIFQLKILVEHFEHFEHFAWHQITKSHTQLLSFPPGPMKHPQKLFIKSKVEYSVISFQFLQIKAQYFIIYFGHTA
jgi:hypothetical protein